MTLKSDAPLEVERFERECKEMAVFLTAGVPINEIPPVDSYSYHLGMAAGAKFARETFMSAVEDKI
jgi:hypothetical protein